MSACAIIDTNVVVAGLLTQDAASPVARILDGMLAAAFPFIVSERLLAEYDAVLRRPRLRRVHGLSSGELDTLLLTLAEFGTLATPRPIAARAPDVGDQHLWELLAAAPSASLVTEDKRLLHDATFASRLMSPAAFATDDWARSSD